MSPYWNSKSGEQPVSYPIEIELRFKLRLQNAVGYGFRDADAAQLHQAGNDSLHERLHLLGGNMNFRLAGGVEQMLQLRKTFAGIRLQLQQLAFRNDQLVLLHNGHLAEALNIQLIAVARRLIEGKMKRNRFVGSA